MNPSTFVRGDAMSVAATAFASEHTTNNREPRSSVASADGVIPSGCIGVIDTLIVSSAVNCPSGVTPSEYTLLVFPAVTNSLAGKVEPPSSLGAGLLIQ